MNVETDTTVVPGTFAQLVSIQATVQMRMILTGDCDISQ